MRRYETFVIIDPDLNEEDRNALIERVKEIIPQQQGVFLQEELWGIKKLAYDIRKKSRGYYVRLDYCGLGPAVDELERFCKIDDRVMKFLTVQLEAEADVDKIKEQLAAAKAQTLEPVSTPAQPVAEEEQPSDQSDDESEIDTESQKE